MTEFLTFWMAIGLTALGVGCLGATGEAIYKLVVKERKRYRIRQRKLRQLQMAFSDRRPKPRMPWEEVCR